MFLSAHGFTFGAPPFHLQGLVLVTGLESILQLVLNVVGLICVVDEQVLII